MAEDSEGPQPPPESALCGASGSSWWGDWLQVAKEKSVSALEFMKKDVAEFTHTMQTDSESLACNFRSKLNQETAAAAGQKVKQGVSLLLDGIKTALIIPPEEMEEDEAEPITFSSSEHIFDRAKARLHAIQIDPATYCNEPTGSKEEFEKWKATFDLEAKKGDISELLVSNVEVRALYTQMVPSTVSHSDFWQRYFYKLYQLEQEDKRRAELMKRAELTTDSDLAWDDEDDWENMNNTLDKQEDGSCKENQPSQQTSAEAEVQLRPEKEESEKTIKAGDKIETVAVKDDSLKSAEKDSVSSSTTKNSLKDSSIETIIVTSEVSVPVIPKEKQAVAQDPVHHADDQQKAENLKTKERGDLVVVGNNGSSARTSPSSSESNSHNKESLDEEWEKDFDIEVTEEELQSELRSQPVDIKEEDEDWENWE